MIENRRRTPQITFKRGMIENLHLTGTRITTLPPDLYVGGSLNLANTQINELPLNLHVGGNLNLRYTHITELPPDLRVDGNLNLHYTHITADEAQRILNMPNLSKQARITGLQSAGFPRLADEAQRLPEINARLGTPPRP